MPSAKAAALCQSPETLTGAVGAAPTSHIGSIAKTLYAKTGTMKRLANSVNSRPIARDPSPTQEDLDLAEKCGKFPHRPSDLFLKIFHDCLKCIDRDAFSGCCSPPLLGSSGVIPISIISVIPDIMRHYASVIVTAESEVFVATNFMQKSRSLTLVADALRTLSTKVRDRGGKKIVVKFMYDRGTAEQLVRNHAPVKPADWPAVGLPAAHEIPFIEMEVINYHRPLLGTFHCKFMVVDRKIAVISSNNIQDRANIEMMTHCEGDIVQGFYDMSLWCWANAMKPAMPLVSQPPPHVPEFLFGTDSPFLKDIDLEEVATVARADLRRQHTQIIPQLEAADNRNMLHRTTHPSDSVEDMAAFTHAMNGTSAPPPPAKPALSDRFSRLGNGRLAETMRNVVDRATGRESTPSTPTVATAATGASPLRAGATLDQVAAATLVPASGRIETVSDEEVKRLEQEGRDIGEKEKEEAFKEHDDKPNPWRDFDEKLAETRKKEDTERKQQKTNADNDEKQEEEELAGQQPKTNADNDGNGEAKSPEPPAIVASSASASQLDVHGKQGANASSTSAMPSPPIATDPDPSLLTAPSSDAASAPAPESTNGGILSVREPAVSQPHHPPRDGPTIHTSHPDRAPITNGHINGHTNGHDVGNGHAHHDRDVSGSPTSSSFPSAEDPEDRDRVGYEPSPTPSSWAPGHSALGHHRRSSSIGGRSFRSRHSLHGSVAALTDHLNTGGGERADAGVEETYDITNFSPFVVHSEHSPVPMAMVNRPAHGMPGHEDILTPQNVAFLAAFKYAKRKVFIQSPTLNASPVVAAIIDACKRGIDVHLWLNLGFNDQGEMIPFQGGTNEEVVTRLYKALNAVSRAQHLHVFWYVGKDQRIPLNAAVKKRNCHIKFMAVDDEVGIMGNGNQDTQSWFHSQEANIMVDSPQIVKEWMEALRSNQNTESYGKVERDGIWRYADGRPLEHLNMFKGVGPFGRILGLVGAFNRATGAGTKKS